MLILYITILILYPLTYTHPWPIPHSGQTKCYDNEKEIPCPKPGEPFYGQDGNYIINPRSFTKLDEHGNDLSYEAEDWLMVRDNVTGLIWEVKQARDDIPDYSNPHDSDNKYTWYNTNPETNYGYTGTYNNGKNTEMFINQINESRFGGFKDWRLPSIKELASLVALEGIVPAINELYFRGIQYNDYDYWSALYWSSTPHDRYTETALGLNFVYGYDSRHYKGLSYNVRAVRGGQCCRSFDHLVINGNKTVTDTSNGLIWSIEISEKQLSWEDTLKYCETYSLAGYSDWRLPHKEELRSIIDYSRFYPAINSKIFYAISKCYWSTSNVVNTGSAWGIDFHDGSAGVYSKDLSYYFRGVRGGQCRLFGHLVIWTPKQAAILITGKPFQITWDTANIEDNVKITFSRYGGKSETFETITPETENDGHYDWTITGPPSPNCMLKIEPISNPYSGTQQSFFTIKNPDIRVNTNVKASFSISGPEKLSATGTSWIKDNSLPGDYTITYTPLACWQTPAQENQTLTYWATMEFQGSYTPSLPVPVKNLQASIPIETWSKKNQISVEWEASDECTKGFSYVWDNQYNTDPPLTITSKANQIVSPELTNGNDHWFHIRTIDIYENASETIHLGPFYISDSITPKSPVAKFHAAPLSGDAPLQVTFIDQSTGIIDNWLWEFGDGGYDFRQNPTHIYNFSPVPYDITLTVTGPGGKSSLLIKAYIHVIQAPALSLILPKTAIENINSKSVTGKLSIPFTSNNDKFIHLSTKTKIISFPQTITMPAGLTEVSFTIQTIDNEDWGSQRVTLTATSPGYITATSTIIIIDDDMPTQAPETIYPFSDGNHRIKLFWPVESVRELDPLFFNIYRSDSEDGFYYQINQFPEFNIKVYDNKPVYEFIDTELQYDTTYWYTIKTIRHQYFASDFSQPVSIIPKPHPDSGSFGLEILDPVQYVEAGKRAVFDISVLSEDHFDEDDIQLRATCSYLQHTFLEFKRETIPPDTSTQLTITVPTEMDTGDYTIDINAISKCCSKKAQITLKVVVPVTGESTITVVPTPNAIGLNETFSLKGKIIPSVSSGKPFFIHIKAPESDHWNKYPGTLLTSSSFIFNSYHPDQPSEYLIKASWDGNEYFQGAESNETVLTVGKGKSQLLFSTSNEEISTESLFQFTVELYPKLSDQPITIKVIKPDKSSEIIGDFHLSNDDSSVSLNYLLDEQTGIWQFTAYWPGNDTYVGAQSHPFFIYPGIETGQAIIVAGGGMNDDLWPFSECFSKKFYLYLKGKRFTHDQIMYFSDHSDHYDDNGDGNYEIFIDNHEPKANDVLEYIAGLTSAEVSEKKPLIIYMHAHGSEDKFLVNTYSDFSATQLDNELDDLQEDTNCIVALILDACKSGAFIEKLTPDSNQKRILISSAENTVARNIVDSDHEYWSFSNFLMDALSIKSDLESGFLLAAHKMSGRHEFNTQTPVIIKSDDTVFDSPFYIGGLSVTEAAFPPEILSTTPNQVITQGRFNLFAHVYSLENIQSVKASIMPPFLTEQIHKYRPDVPIQNIESISLYDMDHDNSYEGEYNFVYQGTYSITFFARDVDNNVDQKTILLTLENGQPYSYLNDAIAIIKVLAGMSVQNNTILHYFGCKFDLRDAIYWMGEVSMYVESLYDNN